jgi:hypothetical protein
MDIPFHNISELENLYDYLVSIGYNGNKESALVVTQFLYSRPKYMSVDSQIFAGVNELLKDVYGLTTYSNESINVTLCALAKVDFILIVPTSMYIIVKIGNSHIEKLKYILDPCLNNQNYKQTTKLTPVIQPETDISQSVYPIAALISADVSVATKQETPEIPQIPEEIKVAQPQKNTAKTCILI